MRHPILLLIHSMQLIEKMKPALDSVGGVVEVVARNVPAGTCSHVMR